MSPARNSVLPGRAIFMVLFRLPFILTASYEAARERLQLRPMRREPTICRAAGLEESCSLCQREGKAGGECFKAIFNKIESVLTIGSTPQSHASQPCDFPNQASVHRVNPFDWIVLFDDCTLGGFELLLSKICFRVKTAAAEAMPKRRAEGLIIVCPSIILLVRVQLHEAQQSPTAQIPPADLAGIGHSAALPHLGAVPRTIPE